MIPGLNLIRNTAALVEVVCDELLMRLCPAAHAVEVADEVTLPTLPARDATEPAAS